MTQEETTVNLHMPIELFQELESKSKRKGFPSVEIYVVRLLEKLFQDQKSDMAEPFDQKEDEEMKKRLKSLGYL